MQIIQIIGKAFEVYGLDEDGNLYKFYENWEQGERWQLVEPSEVKKGVESK